MEQPSAPASLIVGVGASAGGLEALRRLLPLLRRGSSMAYVVVQHVDSAHDGDPAAVLASHTELPVVPITDGAIIEPDVVYVLAPGHDVVVEGDRLVLQPASRRPIDRLFTSIADAAGAAGVGIVLSGAGSDGTAGLRSLHARGGLAIAQEPRSARQPGMAESAVESGAVDLVLPVSDIPVALERFASVPLFARQPSGPSLAELEVIEGAHIEQLADILARSQQADLTAYKPGTLRRRLLRRLRLAGFESAPEYLAHLAGSDVEQRSLMRDLLISVTEFFRDPEAFEHLSSAVILPLVDSAPPGTALRAWVPACATGEEAYSLAMVLFEAIDQAQKRLDVQIFATDIDTSALAAARAGLYPESIASQVSPSRLETFFQEPDMRGYRVRPRLRDAISFAAHDVLRDPPFSRMDLVSCRNLLIYLTPMAQRQVLGLLHFALRPQGHLLLGSAESVAAQKDLFAAVSKEHHVYRKLGRSQALGFSRPTRRVLPSVPERPAAAGIAQSTGRESEVTERARAAILDQRGPPTIVVSGSDEIVYAHGVLDPYVRFPKGAPRLELAGVVRPELATRVRAAMFKCRREGTDVEVLSSPDDILDGGQTKITVSAAPSLDPEAVLVSFETASPDSSEPRHDAGESMDKDSLIVQLERELRATREDLRSTVEELETSNEELRASHEEATAMNEELQSTNEELEASTEELRSVNEEVSAVNARLKDQIAQLERANDDLSNFFSSTQIATVFLDEALRLRRFTPAAAELLQLTDSDQGRPSGELARSLLGDDLEEEARLVLARLVPASREIELRDRAFVRRVLPYRATDGRIRGVVVSLIDVTEVKAAGRALAARERQQSVVAALGILALEERDLDIFMDRVVRDVQQALGTDYCKILELQPGPPGHRELLLRAGVGWIEGLVGEAVVPADLDSQAGFTLSAHDPVVVADLAVERRFSGPALLTEHEVTSGVSCVIRSGAQAYGVLGAHTRARREFTAEDVAFVQSVAGIVGTAIARERTRQWLALDSRVAKLIAGAKTLESIDAALFAALCEELGADLGELWRPTADGSSLRGQAFGLEEEPKLRSAIAAFTSGELRRGEGAPGWIWERREPLWVTALARHDLFIRAQAARELGLVSGAGFPIVARGEVVAVVMLFARRRFVADAELMQALLAIGRSLGELVLRARSEREVESARRWFERVSEATPDVISVYDLVEDRAVYVNGEIAAVLGYTPEELRAIGPGVVRRVVHPDDVAEMKGALARARAAADGEVIHIVYRRIHRDGGVIWTESRLVPFERDADGGVRHVLSVSRDITDAQRRQEALRESEWRFRQILERSPVPKIVYDELGSVLEVSRSWLELTGFNREELDPLEAWAEQTQPDRSLLEFLASTWREERADTAKAEVRTKHGDLRTVLISSSALGRLDDGRRIRVAAASDITILEHAQRSLEEADRQKNYFLALLGHELRNPLAAIQAATDLMREAGSDPDLRERAQRVLERQATHVTGLVDGLLDVSRMVSGKLSLDRAPLELRSLLETVVDDRRDAAARNGVTLRVDASRTELWVNGDALRLRQVFDNLLGNAIKFTGRGGEVGVSAHVEGEEGVIRVRDTGVGMTPEVLGVVFEPFQQAPQELARSSGGLGLGLALSRGIVELHGGTIHGRSEGEGRGTEMTVYLPLTDRRRQGRELRTRASGAALSILVIEDNEDLAQLLVGVLSRRGHAVRAEERGDRAIRAMREMQPDAVLCDIGLPGMNGLEIARAIRADAALRDTLLIAMSGYGQPEDRRRSEEAGFDAHLTKPFELSAVDALLERLRGP